MPESKEYGKFGKHVNALENLTIKRVKQGKYFKKKFFFLWFCRWAQIPWRIGTDITTKKTVLKLELIRDVIRSINIGLKSAWDVKCKINVEAPIRVVLKPRTSWETALSLRC